MALFDYQKVMDQKLLETVTEGSSKRLRWNRCFFVKSRQSSATSFVSFRCLYESLRQPGFNTLFFEPTETLVKTLSSKVRYAAALLPEKQVQIDNVSELKLKNQSTLYFRTAKAENASRGVPLVRRFIADECAFYGITNGKDRLKSLISEVSGASTLIRDVQNFYVTTPNVPTDYYTELLTQLIGSFDELQDTAIAVSEHKTYSSDIPGFYYLEFPDKRTIIFFIHFSAHPLFRGVDIQKQLHTFQATSGQSWEEVLREYHLRWLLESFTQLIPQNVIDRQATGRYESEPDNQSLLIAALDPSGYSDNKNSDFTSLTILKVRNGRCDVINQNIYDNESDIPVKIARIIAVLKQYKIKYFACESNGIGITYLQEIERQMSTVGDFEVLKIHTSTNKRIQLTSQLQLQLELGQLFYPKGSPIHKELPDLLRDAKGRITHSLHSHDDACFSTAFAINYAQQDKIRNLLKGLEFEALTEEEQLQYELELMKNR